MSISPALFTELLRSLDHVDAARHSALNHHVVGMDYLCLLRTERLTVKLYLIDEPANPNGGYLVHPHSHRYSFWSVVLAGQLRHLRFAEEPGQDWVRYGYDADAPARSGQRITQLDLVNLRTMAIEEHDGFNRSSYFVRSDEIHTLQMIEGSGPVLIGLVQFDDSRPVSDLYLPPSEALHCAIPSTPSIAKVAHMQERALELIGAAR